jgi:hypothetical protein
MYSICSSASAPASVASSLSVAASLGAERSGSEEKDKQAVSDQPSALAKERWDCYCSGKQFSPKRGMMLLFFVLS